jgi:hypothetical protein
MTRPTAIHTKNRTQVAVVRLSIKENDASTDKIGTNGTSGVRNERSRSGRVWRRMMTPIATRMNANNVPMLTSWPTSGNPSPRKITHVPE